MNSFNPIVGDEVTLVKDNGSLYAFKVSQVAGFNIVLSAVPPNYGSKLYARYEPRHMMWFETDPSGKERLGKLMFSWGIAVTMDSYNRSRFAPSPKEA